MRQIAIICAFFMMNGVVGLLQTRIVSPAEGAILQRADQILSAVVSGDRNFSNARACWHMRSLFLDEVASICSDEVEKWNSTLVELPNRGSFELSFEMFLLPNKDHPAELLAKAESSFTYTLSADCQEILKNRMFVQGQYYDRLINKGTKSEVRDERSIDLEIDQFVKFDFTPLCYQDWTVTSNDNQYNFLASNMLVTASSRGMFGVDYSMQQFGNGDRMMLDWVLDKHRHVAPNIVELGTFGGVTALYLGMAARLKGGDLDTFDISDDRSQQVKLAWLPNMMFHLGDANKIIMDDAKLYESSLFPSSTSQQAIEAIRKAGVVLVDHADRLNFTLKIVAPNLRRGAVILVHDFPPEFTTEKMWEDSLWALGIVRRYEPVQIPFGSCLATFTTVEPGERH